METFADLYNTGSIGAGQRGVIVAASTLTNTGSISGGTSGVALSSGLVRNDGDIFGGRAGVYVYGTGAQLVTDGSISGGAYAIDATAGSFGLTLLPGATFSGLVEDKIGDGTLVLGGSTPGTLDISSFTGFSTIDFTSGWVLEGPAAQLAAGQSIDGFTQGDSIILDGFSATSNTYISGIGLVLSNATASETLHLPGLEAHELNMVAGSDGTTIMAPISTISTYVSLGYGFITLGSYGYGTNLTITNTGALGTRNLFGAGIRGNGTVTNAGVIDGGVVLGTGTVINTGFIGDAIYLGSGVVVDAGRITPREDLFDAISAQSSLTVILEPGVYFSGGIADAAGDGTLVLDGNNPGTIFFDGWGGLNQLVGISQISFASGHHDLSVGLADVSIGVTLDGFGSGDTLGLTSNYLIFSSVSYITGTGIVVNATSTFANGTTDVYATLAVSGGAPAGGFVFTTQASGGEIDITAACFCRGTHIGTPRGGIAVETLAIGDVVTTDLGPARIKWIGRRAYHGAFIAGNHLALPVKIRRHALGFNVPSRDVFLSPDHGVCEGGVFVPAWRLVNGVSITQSESVERVEYFHIELEKPAVIFAERMPVESFVDADCRARFQNAAEYDLLYPEPATPQKPCRPRIEDGFLLQRIQTRINTRAGLAPATQTFGPLRGCIDETTPRLRGWAQDSCSPETPVLLEILRDGTILANRYRPDLRKAGLGSGCHAFDMPTQGNVTLRRASDGARVGAEGLKKARGRCPLDPRWA